MELIYLLIVAAIPPFIYFGFLYGLRVTKEYDEGAKILPLALSIMFPLWPITIALVLGLVLGRLYDDTRLVNYKNCILIYAGLECDNCLAYFDGGETEQLEEKAVQAMMEGWSVKPKDDDFEVKCPKCTNT